MSVEVSLAELSRATKELLAGWQEAQANWRDPMSRHFEAEYIAPLTVNARTALGALSKMSKSLSQARRDCSE